MTGSKSTPEGENYDSTPDPSPTRGRGWQLTKQDRRTLEVAGAVLLAAAAVVQIADVTGQGTRKSITVAVIAIVAGGALLVLVSKLVSAIKNAIKEKKRFDISYFAATGLLILAVAVGGLAGYGVAKALNHKPTPMALSDHGRSRHPGTSTAGHPSSSPSSTPTPTPTPTRPPASTHLYREITDNRLGTQVFSNPQGAAVTRDELIPFDARVWVKCWAPNQSAMSSINAFYLIETAPWTGDYAPADTFANGDPVSQPGSTAIDPAVPKCH